MKALITALAIGLLLPFGPVGAVQPDEVLADPALEARAREISAELRCVVCQNQSIDDSDAEIARDLRLLVRERLVAGDTDDQVVDYIVARYGDFVLLKPPFQPNTLALWLGPPIMAVVIATLAVMFFRTYERRRAANAALNPLSPEDRAELDALFERIAASPPRPPQHSAFRDELGTGLRGEDHRDAPPAADPTHDDQAGNTGAGSQHT
jgi:cytochrome c-type biogenesis protein CcmH